VVACRRPTAGADRETSDKHKAAPFVVALCLPLVPRSSRAQRGATTRIPAFSVSPGLRVECSFRALRLLR